MITTEPEIQTAIVLRCRRCRRMLGKAEYATSTTGVEDTTQQYLTRWPSDVAAQYATGAFGMEAPTLAMVAPVVLVVVCPRCKVLTRFETRTWAEG